MVFPVKLLKKGAGKSKFVIKIYFKQEVKEREVNILAQVLELVSEAAAKTPSKSSLFDKFGHYLALG